MGFILWILSMVIYWFIIRSCFNIVKKHVDRKNAVHNRAIYEFKPEPFILIWSLVFLPIPFANIIASVIAWIVIFFLTHKFKRNTTDWVKLIFRIK